MRRSLVLLLLAGCTPAPPVGTAAAPIINGVYDPGHEAVVFMRWTTHLCSGTVISPRIVLTAAHCVAGGVGSSIAPRDVVFGADADKPTATLHSSLAFVNPDYIPVFIRNDLGIVILDSPSPVAPIKPSYASLNESEGTILTIVGFGRQSPNVDAVIGKKLKVDVPVDEVTNFALRYEASVCSGDSGGPGFYRIGGEERVVAVTSYGDLCQTYGASQRVDTHRAWIEGLIAKYERVTCERDFACASGCPDADPDCPCVADGHCSALCEDTDSDPDCPRGCGEGDTCVKGAACPEPDPDCGDPCGAEGHCLEACPTRDPDCAAAVGEGATCVHDFDCSGAMLCYGPENARTCSRTCDPSSPVCARGECVSIAVGKGVCDESDSGDGGGCAVGRGGGAGAAWLVGLLAALSLRRRRQPRSRPASSPR